MELVQSAGSFSKLVEATNRFAELERSGVDDGQSGFHRLVALVHQLCLGIGLAERAGYSRAEIEGVLKAVWKLHSRSPFFERMQSWPRGYPGDYETIEYLCECTNKARPETVEYFIEGRTISGTVTAITHALDPEYVEGFVEGCPERIGEDDPDEEDFLRGLREDGDDHRGFASEALKGGVDVRAGRP